MVALPVSLPWETRSTRKYFDFFIFKACHTLFFPCFFIFIIKSDKHQCSWVQLELLTHHDSILLSHNKGLHLLFSLVAVADCYDISQKIKICSIDRPSKIFPLMLDQVSYLILLHFQSPYFDPAILNSYKWYLRTADYVLLCLNQIGMFPLHIANRLLMSLPFIQLS